MTTRVASGWIQEDGQQRGFWGRSRGLRPARRMRSLIDLPDDALLAHLRESGSPPEGDDGEETAYGDRMVSQAGEPGQFMRPAVPIRGMLSRPRCACEGPLSLPRTPPRRIMPLGGSGGGALYPAAAGGRGRPTKASPISAPTHASSREEGSGTGFNKKACCLPSGVYPQPTIRPLSLTP